MLGQGPDLQFHASVPVPLRLSHRNLSKPIAVQSKEKEERYVDNYKVGLRSWPMWVGLFSDDVISGQLASPVRHAFTFAVNSRR